VCLALVALLVVALVAQQLSPDVRRRRALPGARTRVVGSSVVDGHAQRWQRVPPLLADPPPAAVGAAAVVTALGATPSPASPGLAPPSGTGCGAWGWAGFLAGPRMATHVRAVVGTRGLAVETWTHTRSGALSAIGKVEMTVYRRDAGGCATLAAAANATPAGVDRAPTGGAATASHPLWTRLLCGPQGSGGGADGADDVAASAVAPAAAEAAAAAASTPVVAVSLRGRMWTDVFNSKTTNMWHFHAALYNIWVSVVASGVALPLPSPLPPPPWAPSGSSPNPPPPVLLLLLGADEWAAAGLPAADSSLLVSAAALARAPGHTGVHLQAVADVFGGRLVVARAPVVVPGNGHDAAADVATAAVAVERALAAAGGVGRPTRLVVPFVDGLWWDLAWDKDLAAALRSPTVDGGVCRGSLLDAYRTALLAPAGTSGGVGASLSGGGGTTPGASPAGGFPHVCFVSRQDRGPNGASRMEPARNMDPTVLLQLLQALGAPLFLAPSLQVDRRAPTASFSPDGNTTSPAPPSPPTPSAHDTTALATAGAAAAAAVAVTTATARGSIAGHLRFIAAECGVLVGAHGAGLVGTLGLRPGGSVVEFAVPDKGYRYYANVAALLDGVAYVTLPVGQGPLGESDLWFPEGGVEAAVAVIQGQLTDRLGMEVTGGEGGGREAELASAVRSGVAAIAREPPLGHRRRTSDGPAPMPSIQDAG